MKNERYEHLAKIVEAEAGVLDYNGKLGVAQCIVDNDFNEAAFTTPLNYYSEDSYRAVEETVKNGVRRFANAKILQFRSFTKYGINGEPDWTKLPDKWMQGLEYLGKDGNGQFGHFYFGKRGDAMSVMIVIDPGHFNNYNTWAIPGYAEGNQMLKLARMLSEELNKYGVPNKLTRGEEDHEIGLVVRGKMAVAEKKNYDHVVFLSLHDNAPGVGSKNYEKIRGTVIFTSIYRQNKIMPFLKGLQNAVSSVIGCGNREIYGLPWTNVNPKQDYYGVIRGAMNEATSQAQADREGVEYAAIIEHDFHTNVDYCTWMAQEQNMRKVAAAEAKYLAEYFGYTKHEYTLCNGTVTITYKGEDGVNLHTTPELVSTNVDGVKYEGDRCRAVGVYKDKTTMYRLENGKYITSGVKFVKYDDNPFDHYVGRVKVSDFLNVRDFPGMEGSVIDKLGNTNLIDVIGEAYNKGSKWLYVKIGRIPNPVYGYVSADYVERA